MALPDPRAFFSDDEIDRARRYHRPGYVRSVVGAMVSFAYLAALAFTGLGDAIADSVGSAAAYVGVVVVVGSLLGLPLRAWGFAHERRWGFATQSWAGWLNDWAKGAVVGLVITGGLLLGFLTLAHAMPDTWVWVAAPLAAAVVFVLSFLAPVVFEPLFNKFRPLEDEALAESVRALSREAGVPVRDVLVADASRRTTKENAYVSGLGATRRVVVYDTLLRRGSPQEVRLVVAHELGHRRAGHVMKGTMTAAAGAVTVAFLVWVLLGSPAALDAIHASGPGDPRVVPFVLLVAAVAGLASDPFGMAVSRRWERAADRFSIDLTGDPEGFAEMERNLSIANLSELAPSLLAYLFTFSHPAPAERIAAARARAGAAAPVSR
ncbi:MAG: M48 family metalloprotease [Actinomycetota bacterium]